MGGKHVQVEKQKALNAGPGRASDRSRWQRPVGPIVVDDVEKPFNGLLTGLLHLRRLLTGLLHLRLLLTGLLHLRRLLTGLLPISRLAT